MFQPSAELGDSTSGARAFADAAGDAQILEPGQTVALDGFTIRTETTDEVMFEAPDLEAMSFIAARGHTVFWEPRPDWIPLPPGFEDMDPDIPLPPRE